MGNNGKLKCKTLQQQHKFPHHNDDDDDIQSPYKRRKLATTRL